MSLRMVLKSTDSASVHPHNQPWDFRVRLPRTLNLLGEWSVELTEFCTTPLKKSGDKEIFIYCSICDDTIVGERQLPLLRRIYLDNNANIIFTRPYQIPLRNNDLGDIHIYIKDKTGTDASFLKGESTVSVIFRRQ